MVSHDSRRRVIGCHYQYMIVSLDGQDLECWQPVTLFIQYQDEEYLPGHPARDKQYSPWFQTRSSQIVVMSIAQISGFHNAIARPRRLGGKGLGMNSSSADQMIAA